MSPVASRSVLLGLAMAAVIGACAWIIIAAPSAVPKGGVHLAPSSAGELVVIDVKAGDTAGAIGTRLAAAGVVDRAAAFSMVARLTGAERNLEAGEYEFAPGASVFDALTRIQNGLTSARIVNIPEGLRMEQVAAIMEQRGVTTAKEFRAALNAYTSTDPNVLALLTTRPAGQSLEGYLYPATYSFSKKATAAEAVNVMVIAMAEHFTADMRDTAKAEGLSPYQVLTLAAIVEREAIVPEDRPLIASVYLNRLRQDMPLQADPTVQYAVAPTTGVTAAAALWKQSLTAADLQDDSPYNTYTKKGLPPGPIASPGLASITAVLHPAATNYLYFVARPDGSHAFSATFSEHQANVARFSR